MKTKKKIKKCMCANHQILSFNVSLHLFPAMGHSRSRSRSPRRRSRSRSRSPSSRHTRRRRSRSRERRRRRSRDRSRDRFPSARQMYHIIVFITFGRSPPPSVRPVRQCPVPVAARGIGIHATLNKMRVELTSCEVQSYNTNRGSQSGVGTRRTAIWYNLEVAPERGREGRGDLRATSAAPARTGQSSTRTGTRSERRGRRRGRRA